jgi:hypothetical protein
MGACHSLVRLALVVQEANGANRIRPHRIRARQKWCGFKPTPRQGTKIEKGFRKNVPNKAQEEHNIKEVV